MRCTRGHTVASVFEDAVRVERSRRSHADPTPFVNTASGRGVLLSGVDLSETRSGPDHHQPADGERSVTACQ